MLRQFALLGMGIAILPSYLIGRDLERGRLVRLLGAYRLPQVEVTIAYPSRHHLPAKVRTFIDHLVEHFSQTSSNLPGEPASPHDAASRVAQVKRAVADVEAAALHFDDHEEEASVPRGKAAAAVSRNTSRPAPTRMSEQPSPV
jgi:hypothetical protein